MNEKLIDLLASLIYGADPIETWDLETLSWDEITAQLREIYRRHARITLSALDREGFKVVEK